MRVYHSVARFFSSRLSHSVRHLAFFTSMCGDDDHDDDDGDDDVYSIAIHTYYLYAACTCLFRAYFQFSNLYE